jgi:hypothetical protein
VAGVPIGREVFQDETASWVSNAEDDGLRCRLRPPWTAPQPCREPP